MNERVAEYVSLLTPRLADDLQMTDQTPSLSVLVPVSNEESILAAQLEEMITALRCSDITFELLLIENGSKDRSIEICRVFEKTDRDVRVEALQEADYGESIRQGILESKNTIVVIFNVEFWSVEFVEKALVALRHATLVVGSKSAHGAFDGRSIMRRGITRAYNMILRMVWGFKGTDTHGMKAFWRGHILPIVKQCKTRGFVFDTELVLRSERAGIATTELPTDVKEVRPPSLPSLLRRVPHVFLNLIILWHALNGKAHPHCLHGGHSKKSSAK